MPMHPNPRAETSSAPSFLVIIVLVKLAMVCSSPLLHVLKLLAPGVAIPNPVNYLPNPAQISIKWQSRDTILLIDKGDFEVIEPPPKQKRMTELLSHLAVKEGVHYSSILDDVKFMRSTYSRPRAPVLYDPSIVFVGQGRKRGYLGDQQYIYDAHNYLVLTVPMPFECETEASPEKPLLAFSVRVEMT